MTLPKAGKEVREREGSLWPRERRQAAGRVFHQPGRSRPTISHAKELSRPKQ